MEKIEIPHNRVERAVAFVVARLSSSRLPAKQLREIGGKPILQWLTDNLQQCQELDQVVIATVAEEANLPLRDFAQQQGLECFWYQGDVNQVTTRLCQAAEEYAADICLLISGDCPLVYAPAIDPLIAALRSSPEADYVALPPDAAGQQQTLEGVHVARRRTWQLADELADRPELKEHQFPVIGQRPELFQPLVCHLASDLYAPPHRYSVDTQADLDFMHQLHQRLQEQDLPFRLPEVLQLLRKKPQLRDINRHVHQRRLVEAEHKILFVVDSGGQFGFGHLMRSMELAAQLTERQGWPVCFLIDDEKTAALLKQKGFRYHWGSFARDPRDDDGQRSVELTALLPEFSLLVLDIFDQRGPAPGWRKDLATGQPIAVIDNRQSWAAEADLIITPGVTAGQRDPVIDVSSADHLKGADYLIIRREVRQEQRNGRSKDLDLLVYLHDQQQREASEAFARKHQLRAEILHSFTPELPALMARARFYLSGFGISFYEALALGAQPVCWPDSPAHRRDADNFYQQLGATSCLLGSVDDLEVRLLPLLKDSAHFLPKLADGTPRIVTALAALVEPGSPSQTAITP